MDDSDRAELIAALHRVTEFAEGLLRQTELLLSAWESNLRPSTAQLKEIRTNVELWREQALILRTRLASMTLEPPSRPQ